MDIAMLGELEQVVLLATRRLGEEGYGVTIRDEIVRSTGRDLALGTVHKTLTRLEAKGLVESRIGDPAPHRGGRRKRHYEVTPLGVRALKESIAALRRMAAGLSLGFERG